ncbi:amidohydrolase [Paenibacillus sp. 598K]|uniref:M20 metallopeptidase family protein n=1 Tax=Paenibacillus sp. 598K TaxID=1117987 RepID=UPI000FFACEC9|nr:amidohydrolase [Paenibacillus sp. 598K]GBF77754.1 amidohydrolase [Paenibacillus sp. 598K]
MTERPELTERILSGAAAWRERMIAWRRDFHRHPEIGYEEVRTSGIVAAHLRSLGLEVQTGLGGTGVVGLLRGREPGPTIGLRADMDALPIQDAKQVEYCSTVPGKAHLCGHDAHTSILMGAAGLLSELGAPERGNIKFVFQPAEEGLAGAKAMIDHGLLTQEPVIEAMAGLHVFPALPTGQLAVTDGAAFASADGFELVITGRGGHAARPHEAIDAITVSAQVITALQHIASRMVDPLEAIVVTIGRIEGGYMGTAIAPEVRMKGTVRTLSDDLRQQVPQLLHQVIGGIVQSFGAGYELTFGMGYPSVHNDSRMVRFFTETSERLLGGKPWSYVKPSTGGEDFAFYAQQVPGVFFRLGASDGSEETRYPLHHPSFDLDEEAMVLGAALLAQLGLSYLQHPVSEHITS